MHFAGVLGTSAWAGVYVTQVCFWHQRTHLWTQSLQVVHICVHVYMCVYACICIRMRMCVYDISWHVEALLLRFSICAYVCICMCMYMCVHLCVYRCMWLLDQVYACIGACGSWTKRFQQVVSSESKTRRRYGKSEWTKRESSRRKVCLHAWTQDEDGKSLAGDGTF